MSLRLLQKLCVILNTDNGNLSGGLSGVVAKVSEKVRLKVLEMPLIFVVAHFFSLKH